MLNFENLDKFKFQGVGRYGIPQIEPTQEYPAGEFIPVNYHYTEKDPASKIVHFFNVPEECDWNVIRVAPHYDEIVKRRKANEAVSI